MKRRDAFWDRIAEKYSQRPVPDDNVYQHKLAVTRRYLNPSSEVLEIGCGTGTTAIYHAPFVKHVRAIDVSPKMIEIARQKADIASVDNVTFDVCDVDEMQPDNANVDAVLALSLLHLVEDRQTVIDAAFQTLKPGGVFVTSTACLGDRMKFIAFIAPIGQFLGRMPLVRVFTRDEFRASIKAAGFQIDYDYQPEKSHALFLVAKKPG